MTEHPIKPPPELVVQWFEAAVDHLPPEKVAPYIAKRAVQWGWDQRDNENQRLKACLLELRARVQALEADRVGLPGGGRVAAKQEQWEMVEKWASDEDMEISSCLLELRARVQALEAAQNLRQQDEDVVRVAALNPMDSDLLQHFQEALGDSQIGSSADSLLPMIVSETGSDDEPEIERIICSSISGGADYVNGMPRELSLQRIKGGKSVFARYTQGPLEGVQALEAAQQPAACPHIRSSDEGTSYCALAEQTQDQLDRLIAQDRAASSLVNRVVQRIAHKGCFAPDESYGEEARAAIREVAAWLRERDIRVRASVEIALDLEREAGR